MKILALETSAKAVSAAVVEDGFPLAAASQCTGLTHSRTLMPMVEGLLKNSDLTMADMDAVAVAAGPGSFTGIRIGIAAAKGLAWAAEKPCVGVSTLEAMAEGMAHVEGTIVCAMDARRSQVYNALFRAEGGKLHRLCPDRPISLEELAADGVLDGVEVWHPGHTEQQMQQLAAFAAAHGLLMTGGSDFHGRYSRPPRPLGNPGVPENTPQLMRAYRAARHR